MGNLSFALENGLTREEYKTIIDKLKTQARAGRPPRPRRSRAPAA